MQITVFPRVWNYDFKEKWPNRDRCSGRQLNRLEKRRLRESQNMGEGGKKTMEVEMKKGYRGRTGA